MRIPRGQVSCKAVQLFAKRSAWVNGPGVPEGPAKLPPSSQTHLPCVLVTVHELDLVADVLADVTEPGALDPAPEELFDATGP